MKSNDNTEKHLQPWIEAVQAQQPTTQQSDNMQMRLMASIHRESADQQGEASNTNHPDNEPGFSLWLWIQNLSTGPKLGFAASVALACVLAISVVMSTSVVSPAFAAVKERLAQVTSMYYKGEMRSNEQATMQIEVYYQAPSKLRISTKPILEGRLPMEVINIFDIEKGQGLTLMPHASVAMPVAFAPGDDVSNLEQDPLSWVNKVLDQQGKVTELPAKWIDQIFANGYKVRQQGMTITLWVDGATELPVSIKVESQKVDGIQSFIFEANMKFNDLLDPALFDLTPSSEYRMLTEDE